MIEKIMKAVKRGNKKRSINITVGAVVGFLLSCTAVMGADEYLWIKNDGGNISFSIIDDGGSGTWDVKDPYSDNNSWRENTYVNNITLFGKGNGRNNGGPTGYGVRLSGDLKQVKFINNGSILGEGHYGSYGIFNENGSIGTLENNGSIFSKRHGIYNCANKSDANSTIESLINNGNIYGEDSGIYNGSFGDDNSNITGIIENIANNGNIYGKDYGIYNIASASSSNTRGTIKSLTNNGNVYSEKYGIFNIPSVDGEAGIEKLTNSGVVYGKTNAIGNNSVTGTISNANNYGLLISGSTDVVNNELTIGTVPGKNKIVNFGLAFTDDGFGNYKNHSKSDTNHNFGNTPASTVKIGETDYTIRNVKADVNSSGGAITNIKSFKIEGGKLHSDTTEITDGYSTTSNVILNGIENTLKVVGADNNTLTNSIINAYETAVEFDGTSGGKLILTGTTVNGGIKTDTVAISGSSGAGTTDILVLENTTINGKIDMKDGTNTIDAGNDTIVNGDIITGTGVDTITANTGAIINGTVKMGAGDDVLNIVSGGKINGILDGGADNDTLNFNPETTRALGNSEINIQHNISDFETININTNVTLFEKAIADDGSIEKLAISGVNEINISASSVLNLRIDTTETNGRYEGHALFGNTGLTINGDASSLGKGESIIESENGTYNVGVLNLVTNGLGLNSIIAMDGITLDEDLFTKTNSILDKAVILKTDEGNGKAGDIKVEADKDIFREVKASSQKYEKLNDIYNGVISSTDDNFIALKNIITINNKTEDYTSVTDSEQLAKLLDYLGDIYTGSPYSYSSELSRRSVGMFRDIVEENQFIPNLNQWLIMGGLTHADGGTKDTYYGKNYHGFDTGTSDTEADMKLTGAYALAKYGYSENISLGVAVGGNRSEAEMSMSKVKGNSGYIGAFAENYKGNLTLKAGAGIQYSEYDAARRTIGGHNYDEKYSDMAYDIYLNGRYSHNIGNNLFLEPYGTLSYTYVDQDGANEESKALAIETDSKSFDYTVGKVGVDLKKVIPHEKGKSTLSAGVSYTKILDGADEEHITGRFKGGTDFDILVAHKNEHSIGLNVKYALELENGVLFDVKGTYAVERDSHNQSGKNKAKGEWIIGAGLGYKF